jgi:hypothetical protein
VTRDRLSVLNAMDDPAHLARIEEIIGRMRAAIAPMLNGALSDDDFSLTQGMMISAGAMFAGFTVGHLIALGKMKQQDKARATKVVTVAFRSAIILGEREAREAMLKQRDCEGSA